MYAAVGVLHLVYTVTKHDIMNAIITKGLDIMGDSCRGILPACSVHTCAAIERFLFSPDQALSRGPLYRELLKRIEYSLHRSMQSSMNVGRGPQLETLFTMVIQFTDCADESSGSKPMAVAKVLQSLWPAVRWLKSSCAWAVQSLLAHCPTGPTHSSGYPPAHRRCSLIASSMALDRLLRILPPAPEHPPLPHSSSGFPPSGHPSCRVGTHSRPAGGYPHTASMGAGRPVSSGQARVGTHSQAAAAAPTGGAQPIPVGTHCPAGSQSAGPRRAPALGIGKSQVGGMGSGSEDLSAGNQGGEAWRTAQHALLAVLEQEHPAGSAAHAWQVCTPPPLPHGGSHHISQDWLPVESNTPKTPES